MRFILKILAFTALLLISKFTKEDKLTTTPADSPLVIVNMQDSAAQDQVPVVVTGGLHQDADLPEEPVHTLVTME